MFSPVTNIQFCWDLLLVPVVSVLAWYCLKRPKGIPPGPWLTLPVLGDIFVLRGNTMSVFKSLREKHGDIFSFYMGSKLVIVINGYEHMKGAFVQNGNFFNDKPDFLPGCDHSKGLILSSGEIWREQRKFSVNALVNLGMGRNILEKRIQEEVRLFFQRIDDKVEKGQAFDPHNFIVNAFMNVISATVCGKRFELDNPKYVRFKSLLEQGTGSFSVVSFYPFLRYIPGYESGVQRFRDLYNISVNETIEPIIIEHIAEQKVADKGAPRDFIDAFLKEMNSQNKVNKKTSFSDIANLKATVFDLFVAGTETVTTTFLWTLLYLMHFPQVQDKCYQLIHETVGTERMPSIQDKARLPYVEATICEVMRIAAIAPFSMPHSVTHDLEYAGYRFPKDVMVIPNLHSVLSDPDVWDDPNLFKPERFIDDQGKVSKPKEFVPYMIGRRSCLGEPLSQMELFLFVTSLIQKYEIKHERGQKLPSFESFVAVVHTPNPFKVQFVPRT